MRKKHIFFLLFINVVSFHTIIAQNLFDYNNTKKYADYLFESGQYNFASEEYQRLYFMNPNDTAIFLKLLITYRKSNNYQSGLKQIENKYVPALKCPNPIAHEYTKLLVQNNLLNKASLYATNYTDFSKAEKDDYNLSILLLDRKWNDAFTFAITNRNSDNPMYYKLSALAIESQKLPKKSPAIAMALSALIPGTGKMYSGYWKDGLVSLLFVSGHAWQSYRGFRKYGKSSVYGWIFAGLTVGFYSGNIYGSYKTAKKYNRMKEDEIYDRVKSIINENY